MLHLFFNWRIVSKSLTELSTSTCSDLFWNCALALIVLFSKYGAFLRLFKTFLSESESDIQPSMVTHAQNSCSAFTHPSAHTQQWINTHREHTPGAVGSRLCCGAQGAVGGSIPCSSTPQSWYWRWRASAQVHLSRGIEGGERALYIHSLHLQFLPDRDSNSQPFDYESDSPPLGHDPPPHLRTSKM